MYARVVFLWICIAALAVAAEPKPEPIGPYLQSISVNLRCPSQSGSTGTQGSGTIYLSPIDGKPSAWILTAHHVVEKLREVKTVIGSDGEERKQVRYRDAEMIQESVEEGRGVGEQRYDAKVVSVDPRRDIALLRVRKSTFTDVGAKFYLDDEIPYPGTALFHCGAPGGKEIGGTCSLTEGIVSRIGVRIPEFGGAQHGVFDQTDCAGREGSSGGLVALRTDGRWIGMITLGLRGGDSFHWLVAARSVLEWSREIGVEWLLNPKLPRPSEEDVKKIPLELNPAGFAAAEKKAAPTPADTPTERMRQMDREVNMQNGNRSG
jgi:S1-C subfamily serine protease